MRHLRLSNQTEQNIFTLTSGSKNIELLISASRKLDAEESHDGGKSCLEDGDESLLENALGGDGEQGDNEDDSVNATSMKRTLATSLLSS